MKKKKVTSEVTASWTEKTAKELKEEAEARVVAVEAKHTAAALADERCIFFALFFFG